MALVSIATPLASATVRAKWFSFPETLWLMVLPAASLAAGLRVWIVTGKLLRGEKISEWAPFADAVAIFVLAFLGLAYSIFPWVVIDRVGIWEAAHPESLKVVFWGAAVVLPFIIAYNVLAYRIFSGKAPENLYD